MLRCTARTWSISLYARRHLEYVFSGVLCRIARMKMIMKDVNWVAEFAFSVLRHELQAHHGHVALLNRPRVGPSCECVSVCDLTRVRAQVSSTYGKQHAAYVDGGILVHAICFHRGLYSSDAHGECHDHGPVCACRTRRGAQPQSLRTTFLVGTSPATSASSASASATSRGIHRGFLERMQSSGGRGVYLRQNGAQGAF